MPFHIHKTTIFQPTTTKNSNILPISLSAVFIISRIWQ